MTHRRHIRRGFAFLAWGLALLAGPRVGEAASEVSLQSEPGNIHVLGEEASGFLGLALASGDVNGDGYQDLLIGAPGGSPEGRDFAGRVYVLFGAGGALPGTVDLSAMPSPADAEIQGPVAYAQIGYAVATGDVNADGIDDILVGAPYETGGGKVYVVHGGPSLSGAIDLADAGAAGLVVDAHREDDQLGISVASGDVDGDGQSDLIVGAERADPDGGTSAGKIYIFSGRADLTGTISLTNKVVADYEIWGNDANDYLGHAVAAGDIDGDGVDDLIASAQSGGPDARPSAGQVHVFHGTAGFPALIDLDSDSSSTIVVGEAEGDLLGSSLAVGDLNLDGLGDIVIGAHAADSPGRINGGKVYVLYGDSTLTDTVKTTVDLLAHGAAVEVLGGSADDGAGWSVSLRDFNGDGMQDLLVGAPFSTSGVDVMVGRVHLITGDPWLAGTIDLASGGGDVTYIGADGGDNTGYAVTAADLNGDGASELLMAAPAGDPNGWVDAGEVFSAAGEPPYLAVSVPEVAFGYGQPLYLMVSVDSTSGFKIIEAEMEVTFNPEILSWAGLDTTSSLIGGWDLSAAVIAGQGIDTLSISASAVSAAATESGVLLRIDFDVADVRHPVDPGLDFELWLNGFQPPSLQFDLGNYALVGSQGELAVSTVAEPGDTVRVRVTDADANRDAGATDSVTVRVTSALTGEEEILRLPELSADDSVFFGAVYTTWDTVAGAAGDGLLHVADGDCLLVAFVDSLSAAGATETRRDTGYALAPLGDVDDNGQTQAFDAARILAHAVGLRALAGRDSLAGNLDLLAPVSAITSYDAALVIQKRLGLIGRFPVQGEDANNHPQPETGAAAPRAVPSARLLSLVERDGDIVLEADERDGIWSGDLVVEGLDTDLRLAPESGQGLLMTRRGEDGLHLAFVVPGPRQGPGALLRLTPRGSVAGEVRLSQASLNGGLIPVASANRLPEKTAAPARFALHGNFPNPFNSSTHIAFDLPQAAPVSLALYNALGQRIRVLVDETLAAGSHRVAWDGRDQDGHPVASGSYMYVLSAGSRIDSNQLILLK